jgi:glycosyltransferase involved in cell wall biosynthesis
MSERVPVVRALIDCRITPGDPGGVETFVRGLVPSLVRLAGQGEELKFLVGPGGQEWLEALVGRPVEVVELRPGGLERLGGWLRRFPALRERLVGLSKHLAPGQAGRFKVSDLPLVVAETRPDILHFLSQAAFVTDLPTIYHPHDLQHRHLPESFPAAEIRARERAIGQFCRQATVVAVGSNWVRRDVMEAYGLDAERVAVVPLAPGDLDLDVVVDPIEPLLDRLGIERPFLLYPAQTWPHKNHVAIIEALATEPLVEVDDLTVVFTGRATVHAEVLEEKARALGLARRVRFTGFIDGSTLHALYRWCAAVVIPSLFEAGSFPIWEAFKAGTPVVAARTTSLPEQVGDAGVLFDPRDPGDLANAIHRVLHDPDLRRRLVDAGGRRVEAYTWDRTARHFLAIYRMVGGRPLTAEDRLVLESAPTF